MTEALGPAALDVLPRIRVIVDELHAIGIQWDSRTLGEMGQRAATWLKDRHPELSGEAIGALTHMFTFDNR